MGLCECRNIILVAKGESLHCNFNDIKAIKVYEKIRNKNVCCKKLIKTLGWNYSEYGIKKNMLTPTWMKIVYCRNLIYIEGTPKYQDIGKMLIRCISFNGYTIK